jgi:hypothetical protein
MYTDQQTGSHLLLKFSNRTHCGRVRPQGCPGLKPQSLRPLSKGAANRTTSIVPKTEVRKFCRSPVRQNVFLRMPSGEVTNAVGRDIIPGSNGYNEGTV